MSKKIKKYLGYLADGAATCFDMGGRLYKVSRPKSSNEIRNDLANQLMSYRKKMQKEVQLPVYSL